MRFAFLSALVLVFGPATGRADLIPATSSALNVTQNVSPAGAGVWEYTFSFTNTDSSPIWHFLVYTPFNTFNASSAGLPLVFTTPLDLAGTPYDARNIDPSLTTATNMLNLPFGSNGVPVGSSATLSFQANELRTDPFLYAYEIDGNYADGRVGPDGSQAMVHAINRAAVTPTSTPEPVSIALFGGLVGVGGLVARRRMRKA